MVGVMMVASFVMMMTLLSVNVDVLVIIFLIIISVFIIVFVIILVVLLVVIRLVIFFVVVWLIVFLIIFFIVFAVFSNRVDGILRNLFLVFKMWDFMVVGSDNNIGIYVKTALLLILVVLLDCRVRPASYLRPVAEIILSIVITVPKWQISQVLTVCLSSHYLRPFPRWGINSWSSASIFYCLNSVSNVLAIFFRREFFPITTIMPFIKFDVYPYHSIEIIGVLNVGSSPIQEIHTLVEGFWICWSLSIVQVVSTLS